MYIKSSSDVDEVDAPRKRIEERSREERVDKRWYSTARRCGTSAASHRDPMNQPLGWADGKVYASPCKYRKTVDQTWERCSWLWGRAVSDVVPVALDTVGLTRGSVPSTHPPSGCIRSW